MEIQDRLVSIIVPVYNAGAYIEETIAMVRSQTYENWELILVDDCSKDDGRRKIEGLLPEDKRIRLIARPVNEGAARARNAGINAAAGRYIAFLDADDVWLPDKLERELSFMEEKQAAFVFTSYEFGDENARGTGKTVHAPAELVYEKALSRTVIFTSTVLLDTKKTGREIIRMPEIKSEDTATWWKLLRSGFTAYGLDEILVIYRRPAKSLSSNKLEAIRRIWNLYRKQEGLSFCRSGYYLFFWAVRATWRRL